MLGLLALVTASIFLGLAAIFRANSTYSILRLTDQSDGGLAATARLVTGSE